MYRAYRHMGDVLGAYRCMGDRSLTVYTSMIASAKYDDSNNLNFDTFVTKHYILSTMKFPILKCTLISRWALLVTE